MTEGRQRTATSSAVPWKHKSKASYRLSFRKKLLFSVVMCLLALALIEVILRLTWKRPVLYVDKGMREAGILVQDDVLRHRTAANLSATYRFHWGDEVMIRTNSQGFRDTEHLVEPKSVRPRVLVLGDSFAWGFGVENDEIFTHYLQEKAPQYEVINLAVTGYNTAQEHALLKLEGAAYQPQVVLLAFSQNDVCENSTPTATNSASRSVAKSPSEQDDSPFRLKEFLSERSYFYDFVRTKCSMSKPISKFLVQIGVKDELAGYEKLNPNLRPALIDYPPELSSQWESTKKELLAIKQTCDNMSARLVIAAIPAREAVEPSTFAKTISYVDYDPVEFRLERPYEELTTFCQQNGIACVDALPTFRRSSQELYLPNDMHFNREGHRLFAETILQRIVHLIEDPR